MPSFDGLEEAFLLTILRTRRRVRPKVCQQGGGRRRGRPDRGRRRDVERGQLRRRRRGAGGPDGRRVGHGCGGGVRARPFVSLRARFRAQFSIGIDRPSLIFNFEGICSLWTFAGPGTHSNNTTSYVQSVRTIRGRGGRLESRTDSETLAWMALFFCIRYTLSSVCEYTGVNAAVDFRNQRRSKLWERGTY